jgi:hypothetical protein
MMGIIHHGAGAEIQAKTLPLKGEEDEPQKGARGAKIENQDNKIPDWMFTLWVSLELTTASAQPFYFALFVPFCGYFQCLNRSALAMTETELRLIAAPAIIGLNIKPNAG